MFDHPEIAYHFLGVDLEELSKLQTQFLVRAIGGPDLYQGKPIAKVHKRMGVTPFEFNEIALSFTNVFLKNGVSQEDTDIIMKFVGGHEADIVTAKTSLIDRIMRPIYRFFRKYLRPFLSKTNSWVRSGRKDL